MKVKVYVAGSSRELERAEAVIAKLRAIEGIEVLLDWTVPVRLFGSMPPTLEAAQEHAQADLGAVSVASVFWLLVPRTESVGCWVELGAALAWQVPVIASGPSTGRWGLFTSLLPVQFREEAVETADARALVWLTETAQAALVAHARLVAEAAEQRPACAFCAKRTATTTRPEGQTQEPWLFCTSCGGRWQAESEDEWERAVLVDAIASKTRAA